MSDIGWPAIVFIVLTALGASLVAYFAVVDPVGYTYNDTALDEPPENTIEVTCYVEMGNLTTENLQNKTHCPSGLHIPNDKINITVEPCSNYTFANDEPHPCQ